MKKICFVFLLAVMTFLSCRKEIEKPTVQTKEVDKVAETSAVVRGSVSDDGGGEVTSRGFCYGETSNPTIDGSLTAGSGSGVGGFERTIENLEPNTAYYVRAYAINEAGVSYGEEKTFTTLKETPEQPEDPVVMTSDVTEITVATAICGGEVVDGGNAVVVVRGVCWSVISNPTVSDEYTVDGNGEGVFTSNISGLEHNTIYYVRAYATNANGVTSYGDEKTFTTLEKQLPVISTAEVENITAYSAVSGGNVTFDGNVAVTARGVCWSTNQNPTIEDNKATDGTGLGSYTSKLTNLEANTTYYVRAYATNENGTGYGDELIFTTIKVNYDPDGEIAGYGYVDLGLPSGLKWATCNVGATKPEEYGNYYAWGETATKSEYTADNSLTYGLGISELQTQGIIDGNSNLMPQHDAARANWGGSWRMPTRDEQKELLNNCTWEWTTQNGVNGCKVTGTNGNSIFLPTAGFRDGSSLGIAGEGGYYWSATPDYNGGSAYIIFLCSDGQGMFTDSRGYGLTVRPVSE